MIEEKMSEKKRFGADEIMQMATGFWASKVLFTGVELGIFEALAKSPARADELAKRLNLHPAALERLLIALTASGLLQVAEGVFENSSAANAHLVKGKPSYLAGSF